MIARAFIAGLALGLIFVVKSRFLNATTIDAATYRSFLDENILAMEREQANIMAHSARSAQSRPMDARALYSHAVQQAPVNAPASMWHEQLPFEPQLSHDSLALYQDKRTFSARILDGGDAPPNIAQLIVWINMTYPNTKTKQLCSGAIVSKDFILTAAHCRNAILNPDGSSTGFATGADIETSTGKVIAVKKMYIRKGYPGSSTKSQRNYDVALLRLSSSLPSNTPISPLSFKDTDLGGERSPFTAVGWGLISDTALPKKVQAGVVDRTVSQCTALSTDMFFCSLPPAGRRTRICTGDSGGPVYKVSGTSLTQVGINHGGTPKSIKCSDPAVKMIHTQVKPHRDSILLCVSANACASEFTEYW